MALTPAQVKAGYSTIPGAYDPVTGKKVGENPNGLTDAQVKQGYSTIPGQYSPVTGKITSSSGTAIKDEKNLGKGITDASNPAYAAPSLDTSYLDQYEQSLANRQKRTEQGINMSYDAQDQATVDKQVRETGATSAALARAGGYLGVSGSGTGVLVNLATSHRAELQALQAQRMSKLQDARNAYEDKRFDVAKAIYNEAKDVEKIAYERKQKYLTAVQEQADKEAEQESQVDIYNAITAGAKTAQDVFAALDGKVDIAKIDSFLTKAKPATNSTAAFKYTNEDMAQLMGAGFSKADVETLQATIEEKGYTDEVRGALTPRERAIVDSIYYPKAEKPAAATKLTEGERQASAIAGLQTHIGSGQPLTDGTPVLDVNGFITPAAWNKLIQEAPSEGLNRKDFIEQFGYLIYEDPKGGIPSTYKLTAAELKLIKGALPE